MPNGQEKSDMRDTNLAASFQRARFYLPFRQARPSLIVIHTAECLETSSASEQLARYFAAPADGRQVSYHYAVDNDSIVQCVRESSTAFSCGPGNALSINIGLAGRASQTEGEWEDAFSRGVLALTVKLVADILKRRPDIALLKIGGREVYDGLAGICGHSDISAASAIGARSASPKWPWTRERRTFHTDPGKHFPWARVIDEVAATVKCATGNRS